MITFHHSTARFGVMAQKLKQLHAPHFWSVIQRTGGGPEQTPVSIFSGWRCETSTHIRRVSAAPEERCTLRSRWEAEMRRTTTTERKTMMKWRRKKSKRRQRREGGRTGRRRGLAWRKAGWGRHMWCQVWGCWHWSAWQPSSQSNNSDPFVPAETKYKSIRDRENKDGEGWGAWRERRGARRVGGFHLCKCLVHFWGTTCDRWGGFVAKSSVLTREQPCVSKVKLWRRKESDILQTFYFSTNRTTVSLVNIH